MRKSSYKQENQARWPGRRSPNPRESPVFSRRSGNWGGETGSRWTARSANQSATPESSRAEHEPARRTARFRGNLAEHLEVAPLPHQRIPHAAGTSPLEIRVEVDSLPPNVTLRTWRSQSSRAGSASRHRRVEASDRWGSSVGESAHGRVGFRSSRRRSAATARTRGARGKLSDPACTTSSRVSSRSSSAERIDGVT